MKWIGDRISFVDTKQKLTIVITPEQNFWNRAFMGAWLAMWLAIGGIMIWSFTLKLTDQEKIIVAGFLSFWAYYAFRVGRQFFWLLWGKEMLKIDVDGFTRKNAIKGYGKSTNYFLENIKTLRMDMPKERSLQAVWEASPWIGGGERLSFDYTGKTIRFGKKINEKDAKILFQLVTRRIEDFLKERRRS